MEENASVTASPRKSFNPIWLIVAVVLLIGAGALLLSNSKKNTVPMGTQTQVSPTAATLKTETRVTPSAATPSGAMQEGAVKEVTVHGSNFAFSPSTITVKKGDTVKLTFRSDGGFHNWGVDEFNVRTKTIPAGQSDTVTFTADKAGTFEYYCSVGNHRAMGMKGTLVVQ